MKRIAFTLFFLIMGLSIFAQNEIVIGKTDTLFSKVYNQKRGFKISLPTDIHKNYPKKKYILVIALDGYSHFLPLVGMADQLGSDNGVEVTPQMIVVGLDNINRSKELSPNFEKDNFETFINDELIPYIDSKYPTLPYRVYIGHSLAGLRVIHNAIYNPHVFDAYIAVDPSLGEQRNQLWFEPAMAKIKNFKLTNKRLFVAMAQTMPSSMVQDTTEIKKDTTSASNHMRAIMKFSEIVSKQNTSEDRRFKLKYYPEETHASIPHSAMYDGLKFIFSYYQNKNWSEILDGKISNQQALQILKDYYENTSKKIGYKVVPQEILFIYLTDAFMRRNQPQKAILFLNYGLENYPNSNGIKKKIESVKSKMDN